MNSVRVPLEPAVRTGQTNQDTASHTAAAGLLSSALRNVRPRWVGPPFLSAFAVLTAVAFADGGYFRETWVWTSLALASLALVALVLRDTIVLGRLELVGIAALISFVGWVAFSAAWSPMPEEAIEEAERALVYVAGFLGATLILDRGRLRGYFTGIAAATIVVVAFAFAERLVDSSTTRDPTQGTLLIAPFGYANALGIFASLGMLVSLGLALSAKSKGECITWSAGTLLLTLTLIETESRGAWLALTVGLFVLTIPTWKRVAGRATVPAPLAIAALTVLLALVATLALQVGQPLGPRVDYWTVALNQWQENMWLGSGAGTFALYWLREGSPSAVLDAHSVYVETLAEVGPVGLLLLIVALTVPFIAAVRARDDPLPVVGAAAYAAFLVHAGLDWDWEMPAVTLAGLLCGVGVLVGGRQEADEITIGARARGGLAVCALVIAALAITGAVT